MTRIAGIVLATVVLAGCGGGGGDGHKPAPPQRSDRAIIGAWLAALNAREYDRAAGFFAKGAIVDQGEPVRLPDRAAARAFNSSLPCKGRLTTVKDEGATTLGTFALSAGPGGPGANCDGSASVRFTIEAGRFTRWRQLPQAPAQPGTEA
jgi:hypothetical protein